MLRAFTSGVTTRHQGREATSSPTDNAAAAKAFVDYFIARIIELERLTSDPGLLRGKYLDEVFDDEVGDAVDADYDDRDVDKDDDYDPFSYSKSDIDEKAIAEAMDAADD